MAKAQRILASIVLLLLPVGLFQNCADFMTPQHDGSGDFSSEVALLTIAQVNASAKTINDTQCFICHFAGSGSIGGGVEGISGQYTKGNPDASPWYTEIQSGAMPRGETLDGYSQAIMHRWIKEGDVP
ncbi:MAG: hypothetical protein SGJ18_07235 [Pseudomonadota bacterium]|nr:hypothetical protein [Pseudomonadota bacterium]